MDTKSFGDEAVVESKENISNETDFHTPIEGGFVTDLNRVSHKYFLTKYFIGTYAAICLSGYSGACAFAYAAPILGVINADIGPTKNYVWISYVNSTSMAVTYPLLGRLSDIFGRRYFFIGGAIFSVIGSTIASRSQSIPELIGANVFLGIGSATQLSFGFVVGELVPQKYRYVACGGTLLVALPAAGFCPMISRIFIERYPEVSWRGPYYTLIGVNMLCLILWTCFYYPPTFHEKHSRATKLKYVKSFDYIGAFLLTGGFVTFLFGLSSGGTQWPWKSAPPIVMIVIGILTLTCLVAWQMKRPTPQSIIPLHIVKHGDWISASLITGLSPSLYYSATLVWPLQVDVLYAEGRPVYGGFLSGLPGLGTALGMLCAGAVVRYVPKHKIMILCCVIISATLTACCSLLNLHNKAAMSALIFFATWVNGWVEVTSLVDSLIVIHDQQEIGTAGGLTSAVRSAIIAIAIVVYGTITQNRLAANVPKYVIPAIVKAGLEPTSIEPFIQALQSGSTDAMENVPGITQTIVEAGILANKHAYIASFRVVYLCSLIFGGLCVIAAVWAPNVESRMTDNIAAVLHHEDVAPPEKNVSEA